MDIIYFRANRNTCWAKLTFSEGEILVMCPLNVIEKNLDLPEFLRIHKSWIINIYHVNIKESYQDHLVMSDHTHLKIARRRKKEVLRALVPGRDFV